MMNSTDLQFQPHPLLIDHVVENILLSMDPDLIGHYCKTFRLVCQDWSRIATRVYKARRGRITFKKNFIGKFSHLFIRVMRTSASIPFERFRFCNDSYNDEYFNELLHVCSGAIYSLELNLVNPCNLKFPKAFSNLTLGKLKTLIFHVRIDCYEPLQMEMASLLEAIFKISPNLENLDIKVMSGMPRNRLNAQQSSKVMESFGNILCQFLPKGIIDLKLQLTLSEAQLRELNKRNLNNLRSLDVYFQQSEVSSQALGDFFGKCSPKLVSCRALGNQFLRQEVKFPVFPNLRYLSALGRAPIYINYQKLFPVLHQLEICLWDSFDDIFPKNCFSSSCAKLAFPYHVASPIIFQKMGNCFPNLKKLTGVTVTSREALTAIFQSLKSLEVLELALGLDFQASPSLDAIITGSDEFSFSPGTKYSEEFTQTEIKTKGKVDSIRELKGLRYLSIMVSPFTNASTVKLTDVSIYYGFLQLKNLAAVKLDFFPISTSALEQLQKNMILKRPF